MQCLRDELQKARDDRDRQHLQVQNLTAEVVKYQECTGKSSAQLDNLTIKSNALEVCRQIFFYFIMFYGLCDILNFFYRRLVLLKGIKFRCCSTNWQLHMTNWRWYFQLLIIKRMLQWIVQGHSLRLCAFLSLDGWFDNIGNKIRIWWAEETCPGFTKSPGRIGVSNYWGREAAQKIAQYHTGNCVLFGLSVGDVKGVLVLNSIWNCRSWKGTSVSSAEWGPCCRMMELVQKTLSFVILPQPNLLVGP